MYRSFEDLEVWKRSCNLAVRVFETLKDCREFGLRDQMQRSSVSIASNIVEGAEPSTKEFKRYLIIASGSAAELRTQMYIAAKVGLINRNTMKLLVTETKEISRMLFGLSRSLKPKK